MRVLSPVLLIVPFLVAAGDEKRLLRDDAN